MYPIVTWGAAREKANLPDNAIYWGEQSVYNSVQVPVLAHCTNIKLQKRQASETSSFRNVRLQKRQPKHGSAYVMTSLMHLTTCTKEDISTVACTPIMCRSYKIRDT